MPKKINGNGLLFSSDEHRMIIEVNGGYLVPTATKIITAEQFGKIEHKESGFFLPLSENKLVDEDLGKIATALIEGESRPEILSNFKITETTLNNFLNKHYGTKSINEARFKAKTAHLVSAK